MNTAGLLIKSIHMIVKCSEIAALISNAKELPKSVGTKTELKPLPRRVKQVRRTFKFYFIFVL
jgi:hypothetical protein